MLGRLDPIGDASAGLETVALLDSFTTSLMPRTSQHQGLATGLHVLGARFTGGRIDALQTIVLGASATTPASLAGRAVTFAAGQAAAMLPERPGETLWRSGIRAGGEIVRAAAVSGALYDAAQAVRGRSRHARARPFVTTTVVLGGAVYWAGLRLRHRQAIIPRWPVEQRADVAKSLAIASVVSMAGTGLGKGFVLSQRGCERYFGSGRGRTVVARVVNIAVWAGTATAAYNAAIAAIGRANEKVEPAYATPPESPLVSGSAPSISHFGELGQQGRRYVTDAVTTGMIEEVMGEAATRPIRTYVGFNSIPMYQAGRAEMALDELERTGAFDREYLLLISPTGTGWVDQTVVEAAEFLARGDIATCSVQYGRFPSFLCVQKVGLGRSQFRLLLWGVRQRLRERAPENRPKVLVFGESLGAWTSSDVVMSQGIAGFDHYGIDRALWFGLPALAKWSRNGMAAGSNELVPDGTVGVFDRHEQLAALTDSERDRLRAVILSHDNDPIACLRPEVMIRQPGWLRSDSKGRNVADDMSWTPINTFWQVMIDAANAMVTVPGEFGSFGHDYRGDTAAFIRDAFHLPTTTDEQMERIGQALITLDLERRERLGMTWDEDIEEQLSGRFPEERFGGGVPLYTGRTGGARWFK